MNDTPDILESIGHTPIVELRHVVPAGCARVLLKVESHNPTGSMKDRMARSVVDSAISRGHLTRSGRVVEYAGRTVATLACDSGLKYLSTELYSDSR
jgi:cysteine synthase